MTVKMDAKCVTPEDKAQVKQSIADFKANLTAEDLRILYSGTFNKDTWGEVIKCEISAFLADWDVDCSFMIDMIVETPTKFITLHFFIDEIDGQYHVCEEANLHEMQVYELAATR